MDISYLDFKSAGGVTAESIGAPAPVCAPKSVPVLDGNGNWGCQGQDQTQAQGGGWSTSLLMLAAAGAGVWWFTKGRGKNHTAPQITSGDGGTGL